MDRTQTDINQYASPMTFTWRGQGEKVSETTSLPNGISNPTTTTFVYSFLGLTQTDGAPIPYVRDPSGTLVSQQGVSGGPFYYLSDGQGSVAGMADASGGQAAGYFSCPTGNAADAAWRSAASGNPFQYQSGYDDAAFKSYWMDGQQFDSGSGNAFGLNLSPDSLQAELVFSESGGTNTPLVGVLMNDEQPPQSDPGFPVEGNAGISQLLVQSSAVSGVANFKVSLGTLSGLIATVNGTIDWLNYSTNVQGSTPVTAFPLSPTWVGNIPANTVSGWVGAVLSGSAKILGVPFPFRATINYPQDFGLVQ